MTVESFRASPTFSSGQSNFPTFPYGANRAPVHTRIAGVPIGHWAPKFYPNVNQSLVAGNQFESHGRYPSNQNFTDLKLPCNTVHRRDYSICTAQSAVTYLDPVRSRQSAIPTRRQLSLPLCTNDRHHGLDQQFSVNRKVNDPSFRTCFRTVNYLPASACIQRQTDCKSTGLFLRSQTPTHYNPTEAPPNPGLLAAKGHYHPRMVSIEENFKAMTRLSGDESSSLSRGSAFITSTPSDTPKHVEEQFHKYADSAVFHRKNRRLRRPERSVFEKLHNSQPPESNDEVGIHVVLLDTARTTSSSDISSIQISNTLFVQPSVNYDQPKIPLLKLPKNETPPFYSPDHQLSRKSASQSLQIAEEEKHRFQAATRLLNNSSEIIQPLRLINGPTNPPLKSTSERNTAAIVTTYKMQSETADSNASTTADLEKISAVQSHAISTASPIDARSLELATSLGITTQGGSLRTTNMISLGNLDRAELGSTKRAELKSTNLPRRGIALWDKNVKYNANEFTANSNGENESYSSSSVGSVPRSQTNSLSEIRPEGHRDILRCSKFAGKLMMPSGGQEYIDSTKSLDVLQDEEQSHDAKQNGHRIEIVLEKEPNNLGQKENRGTNREQIVLPHKYVIEKFRSNLVPEESIVNEHMEYPEISLEITTSNDSSDSEISDMSLSEKLKDSAESRLEVKKIDSSSIELSSRRDMLGLSLNSNFDSTLAKVRFVD